MSKKTIIGLLLSIWLFAIVAPVVISLYSDDQPVAILNLNEEEHPEQETKNLGEKQVPNDGNLICFLRIELKRTETLPVRVLGHTDYPREVHLPPPELT